MAKSKSAKVYIIGDGLTAFAAAYPLRALGADLKIIRLQEEIPFSSGLWEFADLPYRTAYDAWSQPSKVLDNLFYLLKSSTSHPYYFLSQHLGEEDFYQFFQNTLQVLQQSLPLHQAGSVEENNFYINEWGHLKPSAFAQNSMSGLDFKTVRDAKLLILGIRSYPYFQSKLVKNALELAQEKQSENYFSFLGSLEIEMPGLQNRYGMSVKELADYLDQEDHFVKFGKAIVNYLQGKVYSHLLLPPMLGLKHSNLIIEALNTITGLQCFEASACLPGVPSLRQQMAIDKFYEEHGIEVISAEILGFEQLAGNIKYLDLNINNEAYKLPLKALILACGKEPKILDCFQLLYHFGKTNHAYLHQLCSQNIPIDVPQTLQTCGLLVDKHLNAIDETGSALFDNLFICGDLLGGYDSALTACKSGVDLLSGFVAGREAAKLV